MVVGVVVALMAAFPAMARPGIEESVKRVEALVKESVSAPAARRAELLEETIKARRELIALGANDDRLATWLLDQAEAVLQHAVRDGAELSVLYGIPTAEQRARVRQAAGDAGQLGEQAARAAEEGVARLEGELFAARGDAARVKAASAKVEPRLRVLVDAEQSWRIPMMQARATLLGLASLEGPQAVVEHRRSAKPVAEALEGLRGPTETAELMRRLLLATALMLAGERLDAMHLFAEVEPRGADGIIGEQARLGLAGAAVDLIAAREAARLLDRGSAEAPVSLDMLRSEAIARSVLRHAPDGEARTAVQRDGLRGMARVVERSLDADIGLQATVLEKVSILTGELRVAEMDPAIMYACGVSELESGPADESNPGIPLLKRVADGDANASLRANALWALGTRRGAEKRVKHAADALARLAREFPASPRAGEALDRAEGLLRGPASKGIASSVKLHREVIEMILEREPAPAAPRSDELRSLYLSSYAHWEPVVLDAPGLERLLAMSAKWDDDQAERRAADEQNAWIVIERAFGAAKADEREHVAKIGAEWTIAHAPGLVARTRLMWAGALLDSGDARKSLEQVAAIGAPDKALLSDAERLQARLLLARCQRAVGDETSAFVTLRSVTDDLDHDPAAGIGAPKRPEEFWAAWAEMLEILERQNAGGERTPAIRLQLNRLKLIDAELGGDPWKARIEKVSKGLK